MNEATTRLSWLAGYAGLATVMTLQAGAATWGRESSALLSGSMAEYLAAATPLPAPIYTWSALGFGLVGALCVIAALRLAIAAGRALGLAFGLLRRRRLALGESGQAMTEVAVTFPILLVTTLGLMQLALLVQAKNVVTYAAFAATRAAVVWIPAEADGEGVHVINLDGGDKLDKIQQAASMACVPISPRASVVLSGIPGLGDIAGAVLGQMSSLLGGLGFTGELLDNGVQRFAYSTFATEATVFMANDSGLNEIDGTYTWNWPTNSDVGVRVRHRYYLPIPLVNRIFGSTWSIIDLGPIFSLDLPGRYTFLTSTAVLPLEGKTGDPPITGYYDW